MSLPNIIIERGRDGANSNQLVIAGDDKRTITLDLGVDFGLNILVTATVEDRRYPYHTIKREMVPGDAIYVP